MLFMYDSEKVDQYNNKVVESKDLIDTKYRFGTHAVIIHSGSSQIKCLPPSEKLEFVETPEDSVIEEGDNHVLVCSAEAQPAPSITWYKVSHVTI